MVGKPGRLMRRAGRGGKPPGKESRLGQVWQGAGRAKRHFTGGAGFGGGPNPPGRHQGSKGRGIPRRRYEAFGEMGREPPEGSSQPLDSSRLGRPRQGLSLPDSAGPQPTGHRGTQHKPLRRSSRCNMAARPRSAGNTRPRPLPLPPMRELPQRVTPPPLPSLAGQYHLHGWWTHPSLTPPAMPSYKPRPLRTTPPPPSARPPPFEFVALSIFCFDPIPSLVIFWLLCSHTCLCYLSTVPLP